MQFSVAVTLPDGHMWEGEISIDDADLETGEDDEIDLDDEEVQSYLYTTIADWLISDKIGWRWAVKE